MSTYFDLTDIAFPPGLQGDVRKVVEGVTTQPMRDAAPAKPATPAGFDVLGSVESLRENQIPVVGDDDSTGLVGQMQQLIRIVDDEKAEREATIHRLQEQLSVPWKCDPDNPEDIRDLCEAVARDRGFDEAQMKQMREGKVADRKKEEEEEEDDDLHTERMPVEEGYKIPGDFADEVNQESNDPDDEDADDEEDDGLDLSGLPQRTDYNDLNDDDQPESATSVNSGKKRKRPKSSAREITDGTRSSAPREDARSINAAPHTDMVTESAASLALIAEANGYSPDDPDFLARLQFEDQMEADGTPPNMEEQLRESGIPLV